MFFGAPSGFPETLLNLMRVVPHSSRRGGGVTRCDVGESRGGTAKSRWCGRTSNPDVQTLAQRRVFVRRVVCVRASAKRAGEQPQNNQRRRRKGWRWHTRRRYGQSQLTPANWPPPQGEQERPVRALAAVPGGYLRRKGPAERRGARHRRRERRAFV